MLIDARALPNDFELRTEVCVVGAGPAGLTVADALAAAGVGVCVLESGPVTEDHAARGLSGGENADPRYYRLAHTRGRGFGGTSQRWADPRGVRLHPLDPLDFESRPGIPHSGWPFGYDDLEPYYRRAQAVCRAGPYDYSPGRWVDEDRAALPLPAGLVDTTIFQFAPEARFDRRVGQFAQRRSVQVLVNATVLTLEVDESDTVRVARAQSVPGRGVSVHADTFVLAGGGIENPRLLLLSADRQARGLGNSHDLVGRYFLEHPHLRTGLVELQDASIAPRLGLYAIHEQAGTRITGKLRPAPQEVRSRGLLNSAWWILPRDALLAGGTGRAMVALRELGLYGRVLPGTARRLQRIVRHPAEAVRAMPRSRWPDDPDRATSLQLVVMGEQVPNPDSRVLLGRRRDRFGKPVARVDWRLTEQDYESIRTTQSLLDEAFAKAGIGRVLTPLGQEDPPAVVGGGFHHMGTTRMHASSRQGVVDPDARVHGVRNLYAAGSSVFPTVGYANPTLTVIALALRLGDHLVSRLRRAAT